MKDILAFGSIVIDNVLVVNRFASPNETVKVKRYRYTYGGAGANVAVAASKLRASSGIFAVSGNDFEKLGYRRYLLKQNVDLSGVIKNKHSPMARSFIISKEGDEDQTLYYYENTKVISNLLMNNMHKAIDMAKHFRILHFSTGHFEFYRKFLSKFKGKAVISFDPGQETFMYPHRVVRILKHTDLLFMNNFEAKRIKEILKIRTIKDIYGPRMICISLGAEGALIIHGGETYRIPPVKPKTIIDPTGAGDSHRAGFLVSLLKGYNLKAAGKIASTVASFVLEKEGAQTGLPTWEEVVERYETFFKESFPQPDEGFKWLTS